MDTIFALASGRGRAGVSVIRISGERALAAAEALAGPLPAPRVAGLRKLRVAGEVVDEALVLVFPSGASFTGEDVAELQVHGSPAVVQALLRALAAMPGLRGAEAGEFTRRALEAGRLDLAQVEGLADLIEAETEAQRRQAMRIFSGALGGKAAGWRARLVRAAALLAAAIDFADEEIPEGVLREAAALLAEVRDELRREAAGFGVAERIRDGFEVAIVGAPNAGKSTLLNALAGREAAITSEIAGTTRDVIEVRMDLGGLPVTFLDTAGLRETEDAVERIGIARARERSHGADLRVILLDEDGRPPLEPEPGDIVLQGKADLVPARQWPGISGRTGLGIPELVAGIAARLEERAAGAGTITRERHLRAIISAVGSLDSALDAVHRGSEAVELAAEDLRQALRALDSLVGKVDVEDLLDEIFASFCIGK